MFSRIDDEVQVNKNIWVWDAVGLAIRDKFEWWIRADLYSWKKKGMLWCKGLIGSNLDIILKKKQCCCKAHLEEIDTCDITNIGWNLWKVISRIKLTMNCNVARSLWRNNFFAKHNIKKLSVVHVHNINWQIRLLHLINICASYVIGGFDLEIGSLLGRAPDLEVLIYRANFRQIWVFQLFTITVAIYRKCFWSMLQFTFLL